jgi:hypothetical protein
MGTRAWVSASGSAVVVRTLDALRPSSGGASGTTRRACAAAGALRSPSLLDEGRPAAFLRTAFGKSPRRQSACPRGSGRSRNLQPGSRGSPWRTSWLAGLARRNGSRGNDHEAVSLRVRQILSRYTLKVCGRHLLQAGDALPNRLQPARIGLGARELPQPVLVSGLGSLDGPDQGLDGALQFVGGDEAVPRASASVSGSAKKACNLRAGPRCWRPDSRSPGGPKARPTRSSRLTNSPSGTFRERRSTRRPSPAPPAIGGGVSCSSAAPPSP